MLHLWAIFIGIAAVGLPVLVHILTKARPRRIPLSTIRFVREAVNARRARHRLRDVLVLLARTAAIVLLALAFARPLTGARRMAVSTEGGTLERVVILDVSASEAATFRGGTLFERARAAAGRGLAFESGLRANLIFAGARPRAVFDRLSPNVSALTQELDRAQVRPERLNLNAAIKLAGEMFERSGGKPGVRREVQIISDMQRSNWTSVDFSPLPTDAQIFVESVTPSESLENLAVTDAVVAGRLAQGREARLEVEVANYTRAARTAQVQVTLGSRTYRLAKFCPAQQRTRMWTSIVPESVGWHLGTARLESGNDALALDDARSFVVRVLPPPAMLLVTRQTPEPRAVSSHYLERALAPGEKAGSERLVRLQAGQVERDTIAGADLIVLDHPGKIEVQAIGLLAAAARRGKAVLYVACEPVDAANLKLLADAAGTDLKLPVEFVPSPTRRSGLRLAEMRTQEAMFAAFGQQLASVVEPLRFATMLQSRQLAAGLSDDILATYADRSACLVVSDCGAGSLAVLNADLSSSNLPGSQMFVVLLGELCGRLLAKRSSPPAAVCGEAGALALGGDVALADLKVLGPDGRVVEGAGQFVDEQGAAVWRWTAAPAPGAYRMVRGNTVVGAVASVVSAEEADLTPLDPKVLKERLAGGRTITYSNVSAGEETQDRAWIWLCVGAVCCWLFEVGVLRAFRT